MEKTPEPAPPQVTPEPAAASSLGPVLGASVARVLALQRSAGNAAVSRMLQIEAAAQTGRVDAPVGIVYAKPDMQSEHVGELPYDAPVPVKGKSGDFWIVDQGYVYWTDVAVTAADAAPGAAATVDKTDWRQVLPEAKARDGKGLGTQSGHSSAHGDLVAYRAGKGNVPTVTYNERKGRGDRRGGAAAGRRHAGRRGRGRGRRGGRPR